ncbi:MAG: hypothetical protein OXI32_09440 [bacterium]|nr:hypothetical protein [bacterium]
MLVKGCERRYAIEDCETIRLCTPGYYREDGQSLIWDTHEGAMSGSPLVHKHLEFNCACHSHSSGPLDEERWDDPADLEEQRLVDADLARRHPIAQATGRVAETSLRVRESRNSSLTYGENCLIWCSSIRPRNSQQWSSWRESLEPSYDHASTIRDPHLFAQALGAMALQQKGLLGNAASFRNPRTGYTAECPSLPVVYGPVVYVDDRLSYIEQSTTNLEFLLRSIFTKTGEHRHQREYRFAILAEQALAADTLDLVVSAEMRMLAGESSGRGASSRSASLPQFEGCWPSPRIMRCFPEWPTTQQNPGHSKGTFTAQLRADLRLAGVHQINTTKARRAVQAVEDVDYEHIEWAIANEPTTSNDARIARVTLDAGPGSKITLYDLGGLDGTYRLTKESGKATLKVNIPEPDKEKFVLVNNSNFDGTSLLEDKTGQLTISCAAVNPSATARTDLTGGKGTDTTVTITATSADGTETSTVEIVFDASLGINLTAPEQAPPD